MKIPFDIKYRPQIESGEYKLETKAGFPAKVMDWEYNNKICGKCIAIKVTESDGDHGLLYTHEGKRASIFPAEEGSDLFIITPEPEMTAFEKKVYAYCDGKTVGEELIKRIAKELLALAREQFIQDGYVIEKKAFHDAVEKVTPEVMKEVSENVDAINEALRLEYEKGRADVLKDLPRWKVSNAMRSTMPTVMYGDNGMILYKDGFEISISDLEKLPGFKEDEK